MGFQNRLVSQGMRSMASAFFNEHEGGPGFVEVALAYVDKDEVQSAENRADYIGRRGSMRVWWNVARRLIPELLSQTV